MEPIKGIFILAVKQIYHHSESIISLYTSYDIELLEDIAV